MNELPEKKTRRLAAETLPLQEGVPTTLYFPVIDEQRRLDCSVQAIDERWNAAPFVLGQSTTFDVDRQEQERKNDGGMGVGDKQKHVTRAAMHPREMFGSGGVGRNHRKKNEWKEKVTRRQPGPVGSDAVVSAVFCAYSAGGKVTAADCLASSRMRFRGAHG